MQTVKSLEQCFSNFDNEVRSKSTYNWDEDYDSDIDVDMSCKAPRCKELQTVLELEDSDDGRVSPSLSTFEDLAVEDYDPYDYNPYAGIRALTPKYMNLHQVINEPVGLTDAVLRHGRDVHPTWVKSSIETLSNNGSGVL